MMRSMKGAFEGLANKVDGSVTAQERMTEDFTEKFDKFADTFKKEVPGEVQERMSGITTSVEELQKKMAALELKM